MEQARSRCGLSAGHGHEEHQGRQADGDIRHTRNYHYDRAGVAMLTFKTLSGIRLCHITQEAFTPTPVGRAVQQELLDRSRLPVYAGRAMFVNYP
ncbi:MAG: hypothetical protein WCL44_02085 [bacterium]